MREDERRSLSARFGSAGLGSALLGVLVALHAGAAWAGIHTWDVNEVFSNADGTIQFIELREANGTPGETGVGNGTISSNTQSHAFGNGPVAPPTSNKHYLIATAGFAALPGAPVPDEIIPAAKVPFFSTSGDTVAFGAIDSWTFGAVPTDGTSSLNRLGGVALNSPTNYAGTSGSVDASPAAAIPLAPAPLAAVALGLMAAVGVVALLRARSAAV